MRNIALQLVYQGTGFHGYQVQPGQRTVQSCLAEALQTLLQHEPALICAGRTDAGVHAYAQLVNFQTAHRLPVDRFAPALNRMLPPDLRVLKAWEVADDFSSRFAALARHYRYVLAPNQLAHPLLRDQIWYSAHQLDLELLSQVWASLEGEHDFRAFCSQGSYRQNFRIPIYWTRSWRHGELIVLELMGQSFLYNMVRTLVGTAVDIARGHFAPERLQQALTSGERALVGVTAPPQGLYLFNVIYPPEHGIELIDAGVHAWPVPVTAPWRTPDAP